MKAGGNEFGLLATKVRVDAGQDVGDLTETAASMLASAISILASNGDELSSEAWGALYLLEAASGILAAARQRGRSS